MKSVLAATALAVAIASFTFVSGQQAQAQSYSKDQTATQKAPKAKTTKKATKQVVRSGSPYSTNPANDVYVNGVYVGSDPDWRIRESLKREYCSESIDGCGY